MTTFNSIDNLTGNLMSNGTITISSATNQIVLGNANTITLSGVNPAASLVYTFRDAGVASDIVTNTYNANPINFMTSGSNTVNIGTGSFSDTVHIGNASSTFATLGILNFNTSGSSAINIGTGSYTGTITLGNAGSVLDFNSSIFLPAGSTVGLSSSGTLNIGDTTNTTLLNLQSTGAGAIQVGTIGAGISILGSQTQSANYIQVGQDSTATTTEIAGLINIGIRTSTNAINIGSAGVRTITIGIAGANPAASSTLAMNGGAITIEACNTGSIGIQSTGLGVYSVNIGTVGTTTTITGIINANTSGSQTMNIGTGSYNGTINLGNTSSTFDTLGIINANTSGSSAVNIGTGSYSGTLTLGNSSITNLNVVGPLNLNTSSGLNTGINSTSGAGVVTLGNDTGPSTTTIVGNVNIANATAGTTVSIGNLTGPSITNILGSVNMNTSGSIAMNIGTGSYSGTITLGNSSAITAILSQLASTFFLNSTGATLLGTPSLYSTGTVSQSGTTVTGVGTTFDSTMVGAIITYDNNHPPVLVTAFGSTTSLTVDTFQNVASTTYVLRHNVFSAHKSNISLNSVSVYGSGTWISTQIFPSITLSNVTNQITLGTTNTVTISSTAPSASRTYTLADVGAAANFWMIDNATQFKTLNGPRVLDDTTLFNVAVGNATLSSNTTGTENVAIGTNALSANVSSSGSVGIGFNAGANQTGAANVWIGLDAGQAFGSASGIVAIGNNALGNVTTATNCTVVGSASGSAISSGSSNTIFGASSGGTITTGSNCTIIGQGSDVSSATAIERIAIGQGITVSTDHQCVIGSSLTSIVSGNVGATSLGHVNFPFQSLILGNTNTTNINILPVGITGIWNYSLQDVGSSVDIVTNTYKANPINFHTSGSNAVNIGTGTYSGTITLGNTSGPSNTIVSGNVRFSTTDVTGGSQTVALGGRYWADKSTLTTFTLPSAPTIGDRFEIYGIGSGGWTVVENAGQLIHFGNTTTTTTTGSLSSTNQYDAIVIIAFSSTVFVAYPLIGNITVV